MPKPFMPCPDELPDDLNAALQKFANSLANSQCLLLVAAQIRRQWDELLDQWIDDRTLPLFIRCKRERGVELKPGRAGRCLLPADNSPAQWVFRQAIEERCPSLDEIKAIFAQERGREIPVAMVGGGPVWARFSSENAINPLGWKLAHLDPVRLKGQGPIEDRAIGHLKDHMKLFLSPANMFAVPLRTLAGAAESPAVIEAVRARIPKS